MLLVVSFPLRLLVGLVGLRVDTPHAFGPLPIDDAVLLFTGRGERQITGGEERKGKQKKNGRKRGKKRRKAGEDKKQRRKKKQPKGKKKKNKCVENKKRRKRCAEEEETRLVKPTF